MIGATGRRASRPGRAPRGVRPGLPNVRAPAVVDGTLRLHVVAAQRLETRALELWLALVAFLAFLYCVHLIAGMFAPRRREPTCAALPLCLTCRRPTVFGPVSVSRECVRELCARRARCAAGHTEPCPLTLTVSSLRAPQVRAAARDGLHVGSMFVAAGRRRLQRLRRQR